MITNIDHPDSFKSGVRVLLLMLRAKDGGSAKTDRRATKKVVTQSPAEFNEALAELRALWRPDERIYSTINPRSLDKAIRIFRYRQLDADYFAHADKHSFYLDLANRWISCLKDGKAAEDSLFLFDLDHGCGKILDELEAGIHVHNLIEVVDDYFTKSGRHLITKPFNPSILDVPTLKDILHKDALMLWSY